MSWRGVMAEQLGWGIIEEGWRKGPWTAEEDRKLIEYVRIHGEGRWNSVARLAGLKRNGKSCRLRWVNYLRPDLKRGQITPQEERIILELHDLWGNRWSTIARNLPGRTDNEIKNYWRTHFKKKAKDPDNNPEKSRAHILRKQRFQQQQEQQQQQQQQQQQSQLHQHQIDMKKIMSFLDESENRLPTALPLARQDMACTTFPNITDHHEQGFFYSLLNGCYASFIPAEVSNEDMIMWDGLWNLDDVHGDINIMAATNKARTRSRARI